MAARPELEPLTGLRFFAAMHVVIFHYGRPWLSGAATPLWNLANTGYTAVSLFFVLSGFVLVYNYAGADGRSATSTRAFYAARFSRIYPAYLLALILMAPPYFLWLFRSSSPDEATRTATVTILTVPTLVQAWAPSTALLWNGPAWSLSCEAFFYLLLPAVLPILGRAGRRSLWTALPALWLLSLGMSGAYLALDPDGYGIVPTAASFERFPGSTAPWLAVVLYHPIVRLPEFLLGAVLGRLFLLGGGPVDSSRAPSAVLAPLAALLIVALLAFGGDLPYPMLHSGLLAPAYGLLIYALAVGGGLLGRVLSTPVMRGLGDASYAAYILQSPIARWTEYSIAKVPGLAAVVGPVDRLPFVLLLVITLIAASLLTVRFVEVPARRALRRRLLAG